MSKKQLEELARIICTVTDNAYGCTFMSDAPVCVQRLRAAFDAIETGKLIMEQTTFRMKGRSPLDALGTLLRITQEPVVFSDPDFVWDEKEEGQPHPTEKCTYIKTLDGREFRWTNARFIAVPDEYIPTI